MYELSAVAMMLHRMTFHLYGKVVALYLDNRTAKDYLCNQGRYSVSFSFQGGCQILSLTDKCSITLIAAYMPTHLSVEANYLSWDQLL